MEDCIFCKIANKEVNSFTIFEDNEFIVFLDIAPVAAGHTYRTKKPLRKCI